REQNNAFEQMAFVGEFIGSSAFVLCEGAAAELIRGRFVSANFFSVFGVEPMLGRGFSADEDKPGGTLAVVLSHALWQRRFASNSNIIGQTLRFDISNQRRSFTVVGVMPPGFQHPGNNLLWASASGVQTIPMTRRDGHFFRVVARLKPNVSLERAQT